jgi:hypothetical protein
MYGRILVVAVAGVGHISIRLQATQYGHGSISIAIAVGILVETYLVFAVFRIFFTGCHKKQQGRHEEQSCSVGNMTKEGEVHDAKMKWKSC